jgi:parvulin-like peptidyl-prolyl isomerase
LTRPLPIRFLLVLALSACAQADLIDRIAASVGHRVITTSDLDRQIRVVALENGARLDFSSANKHAVLNKMIEQKLIQNELETSRFPQPAASELAPAILEFKKNNFKDEADYQRALAEYGITEQDLIDVLVWQRTLLRFIEIRFESGIQPTDQERDDYARQHNLATSAAEHALISERADAQADQWLRDIRRRTEVVVHEEALR